MNNAPPVTSLGQPNLTAILFFLAFVSLTLVITYWAARRTRTTAEFFAAGGGVSALQNGFALAGDYMSAASFLGIAGLVALSGFDGLIYSVGWLVGWPVVTFLIAEPLRNLGKYTFADVVAYRLRQTPVRIASSVGTLTVVSFYLIAQMVGAGNLVRMMFGLSYELAVCIVGAVMMLYVLFGGMIATTWVQIVKAVLLLAGATALALAVLWRFHFNPLALFEAASTQYGAEVLAPGKLVSSPLEAISLGLALMFGTAGLPHILMRFYTVPDAKAARSSVFYATGLIGFFYLVTFILGFGASVLVGRPALSAIDKGGNMAAPMLAEAVGGTAFLGFISAVAFATILAVVAGLTLSGAAALSHDLWTSVVRKGQAPEAEQLARGPAGQPRPGNSRHPPGHRLQGAERGLHGGPGLRHRRQRQLPRPAALHGLEALHHARRRGQHDHRRQQRRAPHLPVAHHPGGSARPRLGPLPPEEPGHHHHAPVHPRGRGGVAARSRARRRGPLRRGEAPHARGPERACSCPRSRARAGSRSGSHERRLSPLA